MAERASGTEAPASVTAAVVSAWAERELVMEASEWDWQAPASDAAVTAWA